MDRQNKNTPGSTDPYSNKTHTRIDIILVVITVILMLFAFRATAQRGQNAGEPVAAAQQTTQ